ncbi:urocortin-2 [Apodemus sylvaticus]|uniref:urocortin-2 n=1 Tax=Apodemus sylvaticus TaxID=10129 RepID=UPI0022441D49|nr:urocortin-2 [Apodemus sylvaticus]
MMTRWALVAFTVLMLDRILFVPGTPIPTFRLLPQNYLETTPSSVVSEGPSGTTTGPPASWSNSKASPYLDTRIRLSLDVPVGLLRILLEQARYEAARNQAATNAQILAHVGRR